MRLKTEIERKHLEILEQFGRKISEGQREKTQGRNPW